MYVSWDQLKGSAESCILMDTGLPVTVSGGDMTFVFQRGYCIESAKPEALP